jgi:hypothetical protein
MRVKEAVQEHQFCGAFADNSPDSDVPQGVNENLEEELGPRDLIRQCVLSVFFCCGIYSSK